MSIKFKSIPDFEKPRERLLKHGVKNISNEELISIVLRSGTKNSSVKEVAYNLLSNIDHISDLKNITIHRLLKINGIGYAKGLELIAAIELGKRVYYDNHSFDKVLNNPNEIFDNFKHLFLNQQQEYFYALYLDSKKNMLELKLLFMGTLNKSIVHPRELFKYAYLCSAASIVCIHNHPSGDVEPSVDDIIVTNQLKEIGTIQAIPVIDHIIFGKDKYYSFFENNKMV